jgi:hypothetical protein
MTKKTEKGFGEIWHCVIYHSKKPVVCGAGKSPEEAENSAKSGYAAWLKNPSP